MQPEKKYKWEKVGDHLQTLPYSKNGIAEIEITQKKICIAKTPGGLKAFAATCPHAGARFVEHGLIDSKENITCCKHNYQFNLNHGRDPFNEYFLRIYPVKISDDGIFVGVLL